ncbi:MAG: hypothetical protein V3U11_04490 [Planctomycetota bacterium]
MAFDGGIPRVTVHPAEDRIDVTFRYPSTKRPVGFDLTSGTVAAEDMATGLDTSTGVLNTTVATVSSPDANGQQLVTAKVKGGGLDDSEHKVTITSSLTDGSTVKTFVDVFILVVTDRVEEC